jgi:hypothetical protein
MDRAEFLSRFLDNQRHQARIGVQIVAALFLITAWLMLFAAHYSHSRHGMALTIASTAIAGYGQILINDRCVKAEWVAIPSILAALGSFMLLIL